MFRRKKYKMKFRKSYQFVNWGVWKEITDASLMSRLLQLQRKYNFEIVATKFKDSLSNSYSYIKIKCNKEDKNKIFTDYCLSLNGCIEDISF